VLRAGADAFGLDPTAVREAAAALGSDIPFCLQQEPAWMRGRGEVLDPVALAEPLAVLVVVPPFSISTPAVYRAWDEMGGPHSDRGIPAPAAVAGLVEVLANDLEPAAERVEPELVAFREALESAAGTRALLAGSGSACWIPFRDATVAREAAAHVAAKLDLPAHVGTTIDAVTLP
jgi:4-diphosphocytidyl-2-C-methyl-D-erythritol kinase